jgi:hypothetical protein
VRWLLVVVVRYARLRAGGYARPRNWCCAAGSCHFPRHVLRLLSLRGPEFEQRVALSFGEVLLWRVVDAYSD